VQFQCHTPQLLVNSVPSPPSLSDVDALIAALDRLIAKKRDIQARRHAGTAHGKEKTAGIGGEWK